MLLSLNHFHLVLKCKRFKTSVCILCIFYLCIDTCLHLHTHVCVCSIWSSVAALVLLGHEMYVCTELWPCRTSAVTGALGCGSGKPPVVRSHTFCVALIWVRGKLIRTGVSEQMGVSTAGGKTWKYFHVAVCNRVLSHFTPTSLPENA